MDSGCPVPSISTTSGFMNPKLTKTCSTDRLTVSPQKLDVAVWHFASITEDACKYPYILGSYYYCHYHYIHITTYYYYYFYAFALRGLPSPKPHENHLQRAISSAICGWSERNRWKNHCLDFSWFLRKKTWLARKRARYNSCKKLFFYTCSASKMLDLVEVYVDTDLGPRTDSLGISRACL